MADETKEKSPSEPPATDPVATGVERIRETAKWLIAAFGALGAAIIASLQLSDVGDLEGGNRLLALGGFGLGILGSLTALLGAASVLAAVRVSLGDLEARGTPLNDYLNDNADLLGGYRDIHEVLDEYREASAERVEAYKRSLMAWHEHEPGERSDAERLYALSERRLLLVNPVVERLIAFSWFERVRRTWVTETLPAIVIGVAMAAVGMGLFATQVTGEGADSAPAIEASPVLGVLDLADSGEERLGGSLGDECDVDAVAVVVLSSDDDGWEVVTADASCTPLRLSVAADEANIVPCAGATDAADGSPTDESSLGVPLADGELAVAQPQDDDSTTTTTADDDQPPPPPGPGPCPSAFVG